MSNPSCLFCGAGSANIALASMPPKYPFKCGSYESYRSELCREREAHNQTKRERDEARAKVERQAERIRKLEGATNHACGTPLTRALRERDEAREKYDILATEHMLAINKLCNERDILRLDAQRESEHHDRLVKELESLYEKNAKLRDIAERAMLFCDMRMRDSLRAELDQLKEGAK